MVYTFSLTPDWKLINELSQIDKFGGAWSSIEKREGQSLKQLKLIATVRSVGASTRIEGSKMTDDEVDVLIQNIEIAKLEERDQQEVLGYFEALDIISESFRDIDITESSLKNLHNILMKYSKKDAWHKGDYKQHSNVVEATNPDGSKYVVFQTTTPGFETEDAMRKLIDWYNSDRETHPIIRSALFVYDFLSIHPFQDGNGRLSRLLGTLLLLRNGYSWIQYVSFEHEIESRKSEYYRVLMQCQRERPGEDIYPWAIFFLDCLNNIQQQLMKKVEVQNTTTQMSPRDKKVYMFVESHPGCQSGEIAEKLGIPLPTIKRIVADMVTNKFLVKHGIGAGTNYTVEEMPSIKKDIMFKFTNSERKKEILLINPSSFIEVKKIILAPLFKWVRPEEWASILLSQQLTLKVSCYNAKGEITTQPFFLASYNTEHHFQPVFTLNILIPASLKHRQPYANEYPIRVELELSSVTESIDFEVIVVYDGVIA